jgi:hypothetical protein
MKIKTINFNNFKSNMDSVLDVSARMRNANEVGMINSAFGELTHGDQWQSEEILEYFKNKIFTIGHTKVGNGVYRVGP